MDTATLAPGPVPALRTANLAVPRRDPARAGHGAAVSRGVAFWALAGGTALLLAWGQPLSMGPLCFGLSLLAASALVPARERGGIGLLAAVPAGFSVVVTWALVWGLLAGATGYGGWSARSWSVMGVVGFTALNGAVVRKRGGAVSVIGRDAPAVLGFVGLATFFAWTIWRLPLETWSRMNSTGSDYLRHLGLLRSVHEAGELVPGEVAYPRAFHALGAWLTNAMGVEPEIDSLWRALATVQFLMLALMLMAIMTVATRTAEQIVGGVAAGWVAAVVAAAAFLQTAWLDVFLAMGNIMNLMVGVALLGLLAFGAQPWSQASPAGWVMAASCVAVVANAWQLLIPVAVLGAAPWVVDFLRHGRRRLGGWVLWTGVIALLVQGLGLRPSGGQGVDTIRETSSWVSVSMLERPEWWWWASIGLAVWASIRVNRSGWRSWSASYLGMIVGAVIMMLLLLWLTGSSWELMRYYPAKALWTAMVVVIPLAAVGAVDTVRLLWIGGAGRSPAARSGARAAAAMVLVLVTAGVVGRGFAFAPHLAVLALGGPAAPNWSLAAVESLAAEGTMQQVPGQGAVVFGVVPGGDVALAAGSYPGAVDYKVMEVLDITGVATSFNDPVKKAILERDTDALCAYLVAHPRALRVTGPNPKAGPDWLVDSGCPVAVVRPGQWVSLAMGPEWMERTPWAGGDWVFPTFEEVQSAQLGAPS